MSLATFAQDLHGRPGHKDAVCRFFDEPLDHSKSAPPPDEFSAVWSDTRNGKVPEGPHRDKCNNILFCLAEAVRELCWPYFSIKYTIVRYQIRMLRTHVIIYKMLLADHNLLELLTSNLFACESLFCRLVFLPNVALGFSEALVADS